MPVRAISSCCSFAIQSLPPRMAVRSSSRAGSKPSRIRPPSFTARGASSTIAREISSTRSGSSVIWASSSSMRVRTRSAASLISMDAAVAGNSLSTFPDAVEHALTRLSSVFFNPGICSSASRSAIKSRALPVPALRRPSVRSRSRTWLRSVRKPSNAVGLSINTCTASWRCWMG